MVAVLPPAPAISAAAAHPLKEARCAELANLEIPATNLLSATIVPASGELPEYCRVLGYVRPAINFEARMPVNQWNGKFYMAGCGGLCGGLHALDQLAVMHDGLVHGYAVSTMDGGHWGSNPLDGRWAFDNPVARADFGYRAVTATARVSKVLISKYYKSGIRKSYFNGCSNGGRQGLMEATRYPGDFDGIIAGSPALDITGMIALWAWVSQADSGPNGKAIFDPAKVKLVQRAVAKTCGGPDGLIDDPPSCKFDPASLQCHAGDAPGCLTAREVGVLRKWYSVPRLPYGTPVYSGGIAYGSEPFWTSLGNGAVLGFDKMGLMEALRYVLFEHAPGASYQLAQFNLARDLPRIRTIGDMLSPSDDLSAFKARGGKLIIYQGWADPMTPASRTIAYYEEMERVVGGQHSTEDFARLFLVPGMNHCGIPAPGAPGIDRRGFKALPALDSWVEQGIAPANLLGTKFDSAGRVEWTRPLCPYPQAAVYGGTGNRNLAANWKCITPRQ